MFTESLPELETNEEAPPQTTPNPPLPAAPLLVRGDNPSERQAVVFNALNERFPHIQGFLKSLTKWGALYGDFLQVQLLKRVATRLDIIVGSALRFATIRTHVGLAVAVSYEHLVRWMGCGLSTMNNRRTVVNQAINVLGYLQMAQVQGIELKPEELLLEQRLIVLQNVNVDRPLPTQSEPSYLALSIHERWLVNAEAARFITTLKTALHKYQPMYA